jgi:hypothetical protein
MKGEDESDQLPESGPDSQTPDDDESGPGNKARKEAVESSGGDDDGDSDAGTATGNPANAG